MDAARQDGPTPAQPAAHALEAQAQASLEAWKLAEQVHAAPAGLQAAAGIAGWAHRDRQYALSGCSCCHRLKADCWTANARRSPDTGFSLTVTQEKLRSSWQDKERRRMDALEQVWRQRQQAQDAAHEAELAVSRAALAADCRQAREVRQTQGV